MKLHRQLALSSFMSLPFILHLCLLLGGVCTPGRLSTDHPETSATADLLPWVLPSVLRGPRGFDVSQLQSVHFLFTLLLSTKAGWMIWHSPHWCLLRETKEYCHPWPHLPPLPPTSWARVSHASLQKELVAPGKLNGLKETKKAGILTAFCGCCFICPHAMPCARKHK